MLCVDVEGFDVTATLAHYAEHGYARLGRVLDDEGLEARWFAQGELPWDDLAFKSTYEGFRDYFSGRLHRLKIAD